MEEKKSSKQVREKSGKAGEGENEFKWPVNTLEDSQLIHHKEIKGIWARCELFYNEIVMVVT